MDLEQRKRLLDERIRRGAHLTKETTDNFLQDKIVNPLTEAGYPNLGAGIGAVGSSIVDLSVPESSMEAAMGVVPNLKMAGQAGRAAGIVAREEPALMRMLEQKFPGDRAKQAMALEQLKTGVGRAEPMAAAGAMQTENRAATALDAMQMKPQVDSRVIDASSTNKIPDESMKYEAQKANQRELLRRRAQGL